MAAKYSSPFSTGTKWPLYLTIFSSAFFSDRAMRSTAAREPGDGF
jgi:hypothetical protein